MLDLVSLEGLLAHRTGQWFDRMRFELRRTRENPEIANAIFDGYLCAAEYMLYGATPYDEVITVARDLQTTARRSGALRAAAFASALIGEAAFLSGDLELAATELTEAGELHHDLGSAAGEAHSLQRLAEVRLAVGDRGDADASCARRCRSLAARSWRQHLLQRVFGTMIQAAADALEARAIVDRAESTLGWDDVCLFCSIMLSVPASIACAHAGDLEHARRHLDQAEHAAVLWQDTSWEAAMAEPGPPSPAPPARTPPPDRGCRPRHAQFRDAGQPLDAERCRLALAAV